MSKIHHVNLGVPVDGLDVEATFLVDVLGYRRIDPDERMKLVGAWWFEGDDGAQIHLSADPDHRAATRAHVAVAFGPELSDVERRLQDAVIDFSSSERSGFPRVLFCCDPAGNRWELRGDQAPADADR